MSAAPPPARPPGLALAALGTLAHAALALVLLVLYVSYVPAAKKTFDEYGLMLPWVTQAVIRLSNRASEYWWALVPLGALAAAADFGLTAALRRHSRAAPVLWVVVFAAVLILPALLTVYAVELPLFKLREGLAR